MSPQNEGTGLLGVIVGVALVMIVGFTVYYVAIDGARNDDVTPAAGPVIEMPDVQMPTVEVPESQPQSSPTDNEGDMNININPETNNNPQ